ncbi:DUF4390 domain-containing protein [bacterium]|nr:DUF4390 domain-containing protein [bacterium]
MIKSTLTAAMLAGVILMGGVSSSVRAEEPRPTIESLRLSVEGGYLAADVASSGLFSERITGTVQSGLPAVVDLFYYLATLDGGTAVENVLSFSLRYDVWEDVYTIDSGDTVVSYTSLPQMKQAIQTLHDLRLVSLDSIDPSRSYRVHMSIMINPLRGADRDQIAGWVRENVQASEDDSWHGQVLNLNELISHFFSKEGGVVNQSSWYKSDIVKPDSLRAPEQE